MDLTLWIWGLRFGLGFKLRLVNSKSFSVWSPLLNWQKNKPYNKVLGAAQLTAYFLNKLRVLSDVLVNFWDNPGQVGRHILTGPNMGPHVYFSLSLCKC